MLYNIVQYGHPSFWNERQNTDLRSHLMDNQHTTLCNINIHHVECNLNTYFNSHLMQHTNIKGASKCKRFNLLDVALHIIYMTQLYYKTNFEFAVQFIIIMQKKPSSVIIRPRRNFNHTNEIGLYNISKYSKLRNNYCIVSSECDHPIECMPSQYMSCIYEGRSKSLEPDFITLQLIKLKV